MHTTGGFGMSPQTIDHVARREFRSFIEVSDAIRLSEEDRRQALRLSEREWADWTGLLAEGPLPAEPVLPDMLMRLGTASYSLSMIGEDVLLAA
jgi:hypothetical protein